MVEQKKFPDPTIYFAEVRGSLYADPEVKESKQGNPYVSANVKMDGGGFIRLTVMNRDLMNTLLEGCSAGAPLRVWGPIKVGVYNGNPSLNMFPTALKVMVEEADEDFAKALKAHQSQKPPAKKKVDPEETRSYRQSDFINADGNAEPPKDDLEDEIPSELVTCPA